jgi:hypothetical protein
VLLPAISFDLNVAPLSASAEKIQESERSSPRSRSFQCSEALMTPSPDQDLPASSHVTQAAPFKPRRTPRARRRGPRNSATV